MYNSHVFFENYTGAQYAKDDMCQKFNRPDGKIREDKINYSGKTYLYRYEVESSALSNGFAVGHTLC